MSARFDVFKIEKDAPVWVGAAQTMNEARERLKQAKTETEISGLILDQQTGQQYTIPANDLENV